jgi:anti-sigma factor RsiW
MTTSGDQAPERREIEDLLPWYAAGTLSRRDTRRVEEALAQDPELARRYELVREELAGTIHLNETLGAPSARALDDLFAKLDAEPARRRVPSPGLWPRLAAFLAGLSPRTLAWSASAAALVILLQIGLIGGVFLTQQAGGGYGIASVPDDATGEGAYALVRFAPQASAADVTTLLEANKAVITGGPFRGGIYRLRVSATRLPPAELADAVARLRAADKIVSFIEAAD